MRARQNNLGRCRKFSADRSGMAAVEFAIVAPIFLATVFAIFEAAFYFFTLSTIDAAGENAARLIRTGQAQQGMSKDDFYDEVCNVTKAIGKCDESLSVEVTRYATFAALAADTSAPTCADADQTDLDGLSFAPGQRREVVRVRICYLYKSVSPGIGLELGQTADGRRPIITTVIFRNEPFEVPGS